MQVSAMPRGKPVVLPPLSNGGKRAARRADWTAGKGSGRKRRPACRGRRGVALSPHPKGGRLPRGVGGREPSANRRRGRCRTVGGIATVLAGAAPATEVIAVAGSAVVTPRFP